jgi:hypothetical protein
MISSIEWVPQGVADPNPKKYELSATEQELVKMMERQSMNGEDLEEEEEEEEEEVVIAPTQEDKEKKEEIPHDLPADLRMDEYSSDEDENDAVRGTALGNLLVEDDLEELEELEEDEEELESDNNQDPAQEEDMDSESGADSVRGMDSESDSEDDLADVPDTREYTPIDVEGLTAMGLSQVGSNAPMYMEDNDEEEDDSIADDVKLAPDDAIIVVAKTEEVSSNVVKGVLSKNRSTRVRGSFFIHCLL